MFIPFVGRGTCDKGNRWGADRRAPDVCDIAVVGLSDVTWHYFFSMSIYISPQSVVYFAKYSKMECSDFIRYHNNVNKISLKKLCIPIPGLPSYLFITNLTFNNLVTRKGG